MKSSSLLSSYHRSLFGWRNSKSTIPIPSSSSFSSLSSSSQFNTIKSSSSVINKSISNNSSSITSSIYNQNKNDIFKKYYRYYSTDNNQQQHHKKKESIYQKADWRLTGSNRDWNNILAFLIGATISGISFGSIVCYFSEDDQQDRPTYLSRILNYFWWSPPIGLWNNTGELVKYIDLLQRDQLSIQGIQLLYEISTYQRGREILYRKGVFEMIIERMNQTGKDLIVDTNSKSGRDYLKNLEYQLSLLFQLSIYSGVDIPEETKGKILELKRHYPQIKLKGPFSNDFFVEKSHFIGRLQEIYENPTGAGGVVIYGLVGGLYAYLRMRRKLPSNWQPVVTAVRNTAITSMLVAGVHTYRRYCNDNVISRSTSYNQYIFNVEGTSILYSTALVVAAGMPNIFWIVPTTVLYTFINIWHGFNIYKELKKDVEKELKKQTWEYNHNHNHEDDNHGHGHNNGHSNGSGSGSESDIN